MCTRLTRGNKLLFFQHESTPTRGKPQLTGHNTRYDTHAYVGTSGAECQRYEYAQFPPIIGTDTDGRESASSPRETRDPISLHIDPPDRYARPINSYITSSLQQPHVDAGSIKWPASPSFTLLSPSQLSISPITPYHTPVYTRRQPFPTVSTATIIQLSIALEHGIGSKSDENQAIYIYTSPYIHI